MSFDRIHFGNIADFRNGLNYSRENMGVGLKVINVGDFGDRMLPDYESLGEIDPAGVAGDNDLLQEGDLLFVRSNGNHELVGRVMYITAPPHPVAYSGFCIRARMNAELVNPKFYYYLFRCKETRRSLVTGGVGANIVNVSQKTLTRFDVVHPPRDIQDKCVSILSAYDDLIAANQRRIQLLKDSARILYREWFVKLRFPGHEAVPVVDGVPEGWERRKISSVCSFLNRGIAPQYNDAAKGLVINQKCIRSGRLSLEQSRHQAKEVKADRLVQLGDILINSTGAGTLGRVALMLKDIPDCTVDTHVTIARPVDTVEKAFFGIALLQLEPVFSDLGKGSTNQLELSRTDIGDVVILLPDAGIRKSFQQLAWPILIQTQQLADSIELTQNARDLLLPKLMSGALDVSRITVPTDDDGWREHAA
jgi:type I restriction enzyme S subunit